MVDKALLEKRALIGALQDKIVEKLVSNNIDEARRLAKEVKQLKSELLNEQTTIRA